jgi:UDP-N-acetylmuramoyl-tripeptide--D-alanyl-D-alanine ligase
MWALSCPAMAHRLLNPHVTYIGVTGSCGKTTTVQLIGAVLATTGECCLNAGENRLRPLARSVRAVGRSTRYCVQELSGSAPGRLRPLTRVLRPQIGVITTVGGDHYRAFRGLEETAKEKGKLAEAVPKHGTAILNADDPHVSAMAGRCRGRVVTYGLSPNADVRGTQVSSAWPDRLQLTVSYGNRSIRISSQMVGEHWATSILAAVACGIVCGLDLETCAEAIACFEPPFARYSVHPTPQTAVYILDHKAVAWTIDAGLAFVADARARRKTIVFGTISDYPGSASSRYRRVAREALKVADRVIFVGPQSGHVGKLRQGEARNRLLDFQTVYQAAKYMREHTLPGELILLKGSIKSDHLERIMLWQTDAVVCWKQGCGRMQGCGDCPHYRTSSPPPLRLAPRIAAGNPHESSDAIAAI